MYTNRKATSAASVNLPTGIRTHSRKVLVEGGKWISIEALKRSICIYGIAYFNARRPANCRVI